MDYNAKEFIPRRGTQQNNSNPPRGNTNSRSGSGNSSNSSNERRNNRNNTFSRDTLNNNNNRCNNNGSKSIVNKSSQSTTIRPAFLEKKKENPPAKKRIYTKVEKHEDYEKFLLCIGDASESYINGEDDYPENYKILLECMNKYREKHGYYPYTLFTDCSDAFYEYIAKEGVNKKVEKHLHHYVSLCIRKKNGFEWNKLKDFISEEKREKELYLLDVEDSQALIDASNMGLKDSQLEGAIRNIQRLIRGEKTEKVSIDSFRGMKEMFFYDQDEETSFVRWNSHCVLEYTIAKLRNNAPDFPTCIRDGIDFFIFGDNTRCLSNEILEKKQKILDWNAVEMYDYDTLYKLSCLTRPYLQGILIEKRNPDFSILKFLTFREGNDNGKTRKRIYENVVNTPLKPLRQIFALLSSISSKKGREILEGFMSLKLEDLTVEEVRKWYQNISIKSDTDAVKDSNITESDLQRFLDFEIDIPAVELFCRDFLTTEKDRIQKAHSIGKYQISQDATIIQSIEV